MIDLTLEKFKALIPNYAIKVAEELQKNNYEAFLVGGSLRDVLLGKTPSDFDIATNAYPEEIAKIFPKSVPTGAKFGTITVVTEDENGERFDVEVTTYRSEADYTGGRWPTKVEFAKTIEDDLSRRDFTINAIALNLQHFDDSKFSVSSSQLSDSASENRKLKTENQILDLLVDPFNGISDLKSKTIRAVRDPIERFSEDGLRSVRGCRLASQLGFEIEEKTLGAIKETLHITKLVSIERFKEELEKILYKSAKPSVGLMLLKETGILELFIPELLEGIDVNQPEFHVDDVFTHSLKTCDVAEDSIKLAALFHDIGKPRTKSVDEKGTHFYGHDMTGAKMTEEILKRLRFSNAEIARTVNLVRWHMFFYPSADWRKGNDMSSVLDKLVPSESGDQFSVISSQKTEAAENPELKTDDKLGWSDGAIRRLIKNVGGEDAIDDLMKLRIADASSNPKSDFNPKEIDALSMRIAEVRAKEMALKVSDLDITGHDLTENLGIQPGPEMGKVLGYLLDKVIEEPLYNRKPDLLKLAQDYLSKK